MPRTGDGPYVQSLDRGLAVLRCFGEDRPRLSISDVAREVGVDRAVARRLLGTLVQLGYVGQDGTNFYVRPKVLELSQAYLGAVAFPDVIQPHLAQLTSEIHETSMAFVLDGDDVVYITGVQARRLVSINVRAGLRIPAYQSPLGHVLLAALPDDALSDYLERTELVPVTRYTITETSVLRQRLTEVAEQGYAIGAQELEIGLLTIAIPVHDRDGAVVTAISIGVMAAAYSVDVLVGELLPRLRRTARQIESDLAVLN
ncbi:IclR family transcriptional regulator domain-containing protein [Actinomadura rugatobispora]|uniref:IclR family transcriptional regulator C-terminal domain-containing protein n=1 Tax=Actinomadura rugatobispora TaxID=1994 RepID=A0ABW0ZN71_9ACTN|nr:IclR family transcriptional regulator [Actinomadura rugatobispora]